nr:hypothetical protein [Halocatena marina]
MDVTRRYSLQGTVWSKYEQFLGLVFMHIQKLLEETLNTAALECWAEESTPSAYTLRETVPLLELFGVSRSHQAIENRTPVEEVLKR